jgi:hypothetical protein
MTKQKFIKNNSSIFPIRSILVLTVIICIAVLLVAYSNTLKVECDLEDKRELTGVLRGFEKNNTFWDVKLGNQTFLFNVFNNCYMENLIGHSVIIFCCYRHTMNCYDWISSYIIE